MRHLTPLSDRRREAERMKRRYWSDDQYRLDKINASRVRLGYEPRKSLDEVPGRGRIG